MAGELRLYRAWMALVGGVVAPGGRGGSLDTPLISALTNGVVEHTPIIVPPATKIDLWTYLVDVQETWDRAIVQVAVQADPESDASEFAWVETKADKPTSGTDPAPLGTHVVYDASCAEVGMPLFIPSQQALVNPTAATHVAGPIAALIAATEVVGLIYAISAYNPNANATLRITLSLFR